MTLAKKAALLLVFVLNCCWTEASPASWCSGVHNKTSAVPEPQEIVQRAFSAVDADPALYDVLSGLPSRLENVFSTVEEIQGFVQSPGCRESDRQVLSHFKAKDLEDGRIVAITDLGVSVWSTVEFESWKKTERFARIPLLGAGLFRKILQGRRQQVGFDPDIVSEFITSAAMAQRALEVMNNPGELNNFILFNDRDGKFGFRKFSPQRLFETILGYLKIKGFALDEKSLKEALQLGDYVPHQKQRQLVLPFKLNSREGKPNQLWMDDDDVSNLIRASIRYTYLKHMVVGRDFKSIRSDDLLLLAMFPEMMGLYKASVTGAPLSMFKYVAQTVDNVARYRFRRGVNEAFWYEQAYLPFFKAELEPLGLKTLMVRLHLARVPEDEGLDTYQSVVELNTYNQSGEYAQLTSAQKKAIEQLLTRLLRQQSGAYSASQVTLRSKTPDLQELPNGFGGQALQLVVHSGGDPSELGKLELFFLLHQMVESDIRTP